MKQYSNTELRISCRHVGSFNMDEYADEEGRTAPLDWPGSFQKAMMEQFWGRIDEQDELLGTKRMVKMMEALYCVTITSQEFIEATNKPSD